MPVDIVNQRPCHGCSGKGWVVVKDIINGVFGADVKERSEICPVCKGKGHVNP